MTRSKPTRILGQWVLQPTARRNDARNECYDARRPGWWVRSLLKGRHRRGLLAGEQRGLVEDNATNQIVAGGVLKKLGHRVQIAADGAKALICLSRQGFDLILMDCQMPILNGYETTRMIRSGAVPGLHPQVPVIALTASVMPEDQKKCVEAGMDDYVSKPIQSTQLKAAISRCMSVRLGSVR